MWNNRQARIPGRDSGGGARPPDRFSGYGATYDFYNPDGSPNNALIHSLQSIAVFALVLHGSWRSSHSASSGRSTSSREAILPAGIRVCVRAIGGVSVVSLSP